MKLTPLLALLLIRSIASVPATTIDSEQLAGLTAAAADHTPSSDTECSFSSDTDALRSLAYKDAKRRADAKAEQRRAPVTEAPPPQPREVPQPQCRRPWTPSDRLHPSRLSDLAAAVGLVDTSARCQVSGICEGFLACPLTAQRAPLPAAPTCSAGSPTRCSGLERVPPSHAASSGSEAGDVACAPHEAVHSADTGEACITAGSETCLDVDPATLLAADDADGPSEWADCDARSPGEDAGGGEGWDGDGTAERVHFVQRAATLGCVTDQTERKAEVRAAIQRAYARYEDCAWGLDELHPVSCSGSSSFQLGLTTIDSLDTLMLAGLTEEAERAKLWVRHSFSAEPDATVNLFETTIRVLGGLLSALHLSSGDETFLRPAATLALRLLVAFDTPSGLPQSDVHLANLTASDPTWTTYHSLSEMMSLCLEFTYFARVARRQDVADLVLSTWAVLESIPGQVDGLARIFVSLPKPKTGKGTCSDGDAAAPAPEYVGSTITLGARGDSYYEYMLKQWILSGYASAGHARLYMRAMRGMRTNLLRETRPPQHGGRLYVAEMHSQTRDTRSKMDHLVCFLPGVLALGHLHGLETGHEGELSDLELAAELMDTCYQLYKHTPLGLAPEIAYFHDAHTCAGQPITSSATETGSAEEGLSSTTQKVRYTSFCSDAGHFNISVADAHNILRPETAESLFVLWRVTHDERYQEQGWHIFRAIEAHARTLQGGYSSIESVTDDCPLHSDKMESFFLAETLKYLYLLFEDTEVLPLDEYVFNTEGHPLPIAKRRAEKSHSRWYMPHVRTTQCAPFTRASILEQIVITERLVAARGLHSL